MKLNRITITKFALFGAIIAGGRYSAVAQNTNTLLPFGNVGVGILNPTAAKLQVKGSTLLQTLTVTEGAIFKDATTFEKQLTVSGKSVLSETNIGGVLKLRATTLLETVAPDFQVLVKNPINGEVLSVGLRDLNSALYNTGCLINGLATGNSNKADDIGIERPLWQNKPGILYVKCPDVLRVGIRTETPTHTFTVNGDGSFSNTLEVLGQLSLGTSPTASSKFFIRNTSYLNGLYINQTGNTLGTSRLLHLEYNKASTEIIRVANSTTGTVPFLLKADGTMRLHNGSRITFLLNPDGFMRTRRIRVDMEDDWADYVFDSDYELMPLNEVENFIKLHKHLPRIPSAVEVEKNGVDVAEMNVLLMEKIEELTLYLIQVKKQNDDLMKRLETIENQIK